MRVLFPHHSLPESTGAIMRQFDNEKLNVCQTAVVFVAWSSDLLTPRAAMFDVLP